MTDERPLLRHPTLYITMYPVAGTQCWECHYGTGFTDSFSVRKHRRDPSDVLGEMASDSEVWTADAEYALNASWYEVTFRDHCGTFTATGNEHADDETAWDQLMDALAARMPDFHKRVRRAEQLAEDAERARKNAEEEMPI